MQYLVTFTQHYEYLVDAEDEQEAEKKAYEQFNSDMHYPVARTSYDECEIECSEDEEE